MTTSSISLSCKALAACRRLGITEAAAKRARASSSSSHETPAFLVVTGELEDGTPVLFKCQHDRPGHVIELHLR